MNAETTESSLSFVAIRDIKPGMRGLKIAALVTRKDMQYEIATRYGPALVCDAELADSTGNIAWRLWRDQIGLVDVGDRVILENGFVRSFGERAELNLGRDGKVTVQERRIGL